jgi:DNA-binding transcriptional MerR regulator
MSEPYFLAVVTEIHASGTTYSLEEVAELAGLQSELLRHYCRLGLFGKAKLGPESELRFDDDDLYELRRFKHFRETHQVKTKTLRLILRLWRDIELLQAELRFLRRR